MALPALSLPRKILYAVILTVGVTALLLGTIEAGLRLAGYGYSPHFARRVARPTGETVWRENRWCTAPFFSPELVRRPQSFRLEVKKSLGTYRIFVLGSSAAMGDPEASFSLARMLETMLRAAYPQQRFEVINAAITAINSHLVRDIAEDCAQLEPDLFIVYEGNNEVIGPYGPTGVLAPFLHSETLIRTTEWLKGTRTGQLLASVVRRGPPPEWRGMQMFLQRQITADDPRLDAVRAHFRANLLAVADAGRRVGADTLVCTVLTNQRDFAPFLSQHRPGLTADELARWQSSYETGKVTEQAGDLTAAAAAYHAAAVIDDRHAELNYRLGRLALQTGADRDARLFLQRALDLDTLRFRTDSTLNQVVRDLGEAGTSGLQVVDVAAELSARSAHGIPGEEFLYEHVHLNFRGTFELAGALFPRVLARLQHRGLARRPTVVPPSYDDVRLRLAYTAHEQAMIALNLLGRFRVAPFTGQTDNPARVETWERRVAAAEKLLSRPEALPALNSIYQQALAFAPDDWILARNTGMMLVGRGAPAEAVPLLERSGAWIDDDIDTLVALGRAHQALGHRAAAETTFARARLLEPRYPGLPAPTK